jgi:hypothetical protein
MPTVFTPSKGPEEDFPPKFMAGLLGGLLIWSVLLLTITGFFVFRSDSKLMKGIFLAIGGVVIMAILVQQVVIPTFTVWWDNLDVDKDENNQIIGPPASTASKLPLV